VRFRKLQSFDSQILAFLFQQCQIYLQVGRKEFQDRMVKLSYLSNALYCRKFESIKGQSYYVNLNTKQTQWELPTKPAEMGPGGEKVTCILPINTEGYIFMSFVFFEGSGKSYIGQT